LHPQWPAQIPKMGQKMDFVLWGLILKLGFQVLPPYITQKKFGSSPLLNF
jgi:hypothetical protein